MPYTSTVVGAETWHGLIPGLINEAVLLRSGVHVIQTEGRVAHVPLAADSEPAWYSELEEIEASDDTPDELVLVPKKVASLTILSNESATDSSPDVTAGVEASVIADLAAAADKGLFAGTGGKQPTGLMTTAAALPTDATLDVDYAGLARGAGKVRAAGGRADVAYINPADLVELQLAADGADRPLIGRAEDGVPQFVAGLRLWDSPAIPAGQALIAQANMIAVAVRLDGRVDISDEAKFGADAMVLRAVSRLDVGVKRPAATLVIGDPTP